MAHTSKALTGRVRVKAPDGRILTFGPGVVEAPKAVVDHLEETVTNEGAWTDVEPSGANEHEPEGASEPETAGEAPKRNAGAAAWSAYFQEVTGEMPADGTSRDDMIAELEGRGLLPA